MQLSLVEPQKILGGRGECRVGVCLVGDGGEKWGWNIKAGDDQHGVLSLLIANTLETLGGFQSIISVFYDFTSAT